MILGIKKAHQFPLMPLTEPLQPRPSPGFSGAGRVRPEQGVKPRSPANVLPTLMQFGMGSAAVGLFVAAYGLHCPQYLTAANLTVLSMGILHFARAERNFAGTFSAQAIQRASRLFQSAEILNGFFTLFGLGLSLAYPDSRAGLFVGTLGTMFGVYAFDYTSRRTFGDCESEINGSSRRCHEFYYDDAQFEADLKAFRARLVSNPLREACQILGISEEDAKNKQTVKKAFHKLARQYHPDRNPGDQEAAKQFIKVREAFDTICRIMAVR